MKVISTWLTKTLFDAYREERTRKHPNHPKLQTPTPRTQKRLDITTIVLTPLQHSNEQ